MFYYGGGQIGVVLGVVDDDGEFVGFVGFCVGGIVGYIDLLFGIVFDGDGDDSYYVLVIDVGQVFEFGSVEFFECIVEVQIV